MLRLIDNTLNEYKEKHKRTKTYKNTNKVTNLLKTLANGDLTNKVTTKLSPRRLHEVDTTYDDDLMTRHKLSTKLRNDIPKHATIDENSNDYLKNTNDVMKLNDELIKSINPQGEVVVDNFRQKSLLYEQPKNKPTTIYEQNTKPKYDIEHETTDQNTNKNSQSTNDNSDVTKLDEELIKSINPQGEVVVVDSIPKSLLSEQLTNEPTTNDEQSTKRQNDMTQHAITNENTYKKPQNTNDNLGITKLDEELIKSINSQGEVVVDNSRKPSSLFSEQPSKYDSAGINKEDTQNDLMKTNLLTNINQTELEDNILDNTQDEEAFIKSINPAGGVVVNIDSEGKLKVLTTDKNVKEETKLLDVTYRTI